MSDSEEDLILKQQGILELFFKYVGHFAFDKAKDFLEKEREAAARSHHVAPLFNSVLTAFSQLATAEKSYACFIFLGPKGFLRKDSSLKSMYESLRNEFQRLEDKRYITPVPTPTMSPTLSSRTPSPTTPSPSPSISIGSETSGSALSSLSIGSSVWGSFIHSSQVYQGSDVLDNLASHLCGQLLHFVSARLETMDFYEKLCASSSLRFMNTDHLLSLISEIVKSNQKLFHHPLLSPLKSSFSYECEILMKLMECQANMQQWRFLPSLLCLHEAHSKLGAWTSITKEVKKGTPIANSRLPSAPPIYHWLCTLKSALASKFTLYFHEILSKQTIPQEMKNVCCKSTTDHFQRLVNFQKRYDATCVALVLDTNGLDDYRGHGYAYPGKHYEAPKGLNSYPAVVCSPPEKPISHWPSVVMIMDNEHKELKNSDSVVTFYDKRVNSTYFLAKVESRMTLVIIFDSKKSERDAYVTRYMHTLCAQLRCNKVFASLKPGSK